MRSSYGYDSYRGRGGARLFLKVLIGILAVVLLLAIVFFFWAQKYMVYGDDGKAHLELPWFQEKETPAPTPPVSSQSVVVVTASPTPEPTPTPQPTAAVLPLSESYLTGEPPPAAVTGGEYTAGLLDMKGDDGMLHYVSDLKAAKDMGTSDATPGRNEAIRTLSAGEFPLIARVSCFRDNRVPRNDHSMSLRSTLGNWLDAEKNRWTNPSSEKTRNYVSGICGELAALGFDEILLDNACYPTNGNTGIIVVGESYDPDHLDVAVGQFYEAVRTALAAYPGVKLSIVADPESIAEDGAHTGQTLALLKEYAYRVYVRTEDAAALQAAQAALVGAGLEESQVVSYHPLYPNAPALAAAGGEATYLTGGEASPAE